MLSLYVFSMFILVVGSVVGMVVGWMFGMSGATGVSVAVAFLLAHEGSL